MSTPEPQTPQQTAVSKALTYMDLAEAEMAKKTGASMPRATVCCMLANLHFVKAQLLPGDGYVQFPDPPPAA